MTNLIASIVISFATNWTHVSTITPAPCGVVGCLVYHGSTRNFSGAVVRRRALQFEFEGRPHSVVLDETPAGQTLSKSESGGIEFSFSTNSLGQITITP